MRIFHYPRFYLSTKYIKFSWFLFKEIVNCIWFIVQVTPILNRISIAASFFDPFYVDNNRNSRIELLSIDSEEDENVYIDEYGTYTSGEVDHDFKNNMLDAISEGGPKN